MQSSILKNYDLLMVTEETRNEVIPLFSQPGTIYRVEWQNGYGVFITCFGTIFGCLVSLDAALRMRNAWLAEQAPNGLRSRS